MANDNQIAFLCSRLKELREKNGCTMDDMAKKIDVLEGLKPGTGMNKSSISRVEGGKTTEKTLLEMANISLYKEVNGKYPSMNCTVEKEIIDNPEETISFFEQFGNRITFSRMIGKQGISLLDFNTFLNKAMERLNVRTGGYDCTMYGGMCGAGMDNIFYANGKIFI